MQWLDAYEDVCAYDLICHHYGRKAHDGMTDGNWTLVFLDSFSLPLIVGMLCCCIRIYIPLAFHYHHCKIVSFLFNLSLLGPCGSPCQSRNCLLRHEKASSSMATGTCTNGSDLHLMPIITIP